jgi:hypothetical protein
MIVGNCSAYFATYRGNSELAAPPCAPFTKDQSDRGVGIRHGATILGQPSLRDLGLLHPGFRHSAAPASPAGGLRAGLITIAPLFLRQGRPALGPRPPASAQKKQIPHGVRTLRGRVPFAKNAPFLRPFLRQGKQSEQGRRDDGVSAAFPNSAGLPFLRQGKKDPFLCQGKPALRLNLRPESRRDAGGTVKLFGRRGRQTGRTKRDSSAANGAASE